MASATAAQPWQHMARAAPATVASMWTSAGTGVPQWKQATGAAGGGGGGVTQVAADETVAAGGTVAGAGA
jgi:hypothetical protein